MKGRRGNKDILFFYFWRDIERKEAVAGSCVRDEHLIRQRSPLRYRSQKQCHYLFLRLSVDHSCLPLPSFPFYQAQKYHKSLLSLSIHVHVKH